MSLDILGKISSNAEYQALLCQHLRDIASSTGVGVEVDALDPEDIAGLEELGPAPQGFYFSVSSSPDESEATDLWNEAYILARTILQGSMGENAMHVANSVGEVIWPETYIDEMQQCRLARFLDLLAGMQGYRSICIALIDGGIESEFRGTAEECIEEILRMVLLPWDNSPNTLYIWKRPDKETGGSSE